MATYVPLNGLILPIVELGIRHVFGGENVGNWMEN